MVKIAILGANGFIGCRTVEMFHLLNWAEVRPVVRNIANLASLSKFDLDGRVADGFDQPALTLALQGCDVVVHAIAGDRRTILGTLAPTYQAAQEAGVKRMIYLSTASVHGQSPAPGTDESSPLSDRQMIAYNNYKVQAERLLFQLRRQGKVEVVFLRPGIVFGPRSFWVSSFADRVLAGQAYLVNQGQGICNSIYVDNLVWAIYLATTAKDVDQQAFLLGDCERITWSEFYRPIATALGFDITQVPSVTYIPPSPGWSSRVKKILDSKPLSALLSLLPNKWRHAVRAARSALFAAPVRHHSAWDFPKDLPPVPQPTLEMTLLYQCQYKFPHQKAYKILGYEPIVTFPEACKRTVGWMAFAGFPVAETSDLKIQQTYFFIK
ncbi:MAG: NAD-dependent epimerase/dehydratase family protein [Candidatus Loosdrechtia sp.]|uniref:NAD-dependent epimerase/dehydratase family protein n=1 Tax=Candidatus Loosdrechtia sp. TaxID=3101272 RepID=UPI00403ADF46